MSHIPLRFAKKCFEADNVIIQQCECCNKINVYMIDGKHTIKAVGVLDPEMLFEIANAVAASNDDDDEPEVATIN